MSIRLTVLGSSGMYATRERACSGYLLELGDRRLWLDAGAGTWRNLLGHIDYERLDGVMLSHRHPDHITDLFQAYHARLYGPRGELARIPLWAPAETLDVITHLAPKLEEAFDLRAIEAGGSMRWGDAGFWFTEMAHPPETLGIRIERDDTVIAYSSDTGPGADFSSLAEDANLFVCEATLQDSDEEWEGHLRASAAGVIGARCNVARLYLTHLPPERDAERSLAEARAGAGELDVETASDGQQIEVKG